MVGASPISEAARRRKAPTSRVAVGERPADARSGVDGRDEPGHDDFWLAADPLGRRRRSLQLGGVCLNYLLREAKFAVVPVLVVRPQHAIGEMPPIRRIWESLRLEGQARMRAVMLAVQSGRRTVERRRIVELDAGLG
jgi:hypothetical protein